MLKKKNSIILASALLCLCSTSIFATTNDPVDTNEIMVGEYAYDIAPCTLYDYIGSATDITIKPGATYHFKGPKKDGFKTLNGLGMTYYSAFRVYGNIAETDSEINLLVEARELNGDYSCGYIKSDGDYAYLSGLEEGIYLITVTNKGDTSITLDSLKLKTVKSSLKNVY